MKKTSKLTMAVVSIIVLAASAFLSCSKGNAIGEEAIWQANVTERHIGPVEGSYANGVVEFRCIDSFWVEYMGETYPSTHFCNSQYRFDGGNEEEIAALSGCYAVDTTTQPYRILGTSLTLTFVRDEVEEALVTLIGNVDPTDFRSRFNTCHIGIVGVCVNPEEHDIVFKGIDEKGDTAFARGRWYGTIHDTTVVVQHDTIHHYDTTIVTHTDTVYLHDTIRVIQIDTVFGLDTVFLHDTIVRIDTVWWQDSSVTELTHILSNPGSRVNDSLKYSCVNRMTTKLYRNGSLVSQNFQNFIGNFSYHWSASGSVRPEHVGMKMPLVAGNAVFGSGLSFHQGNQHKYATPASFLAQFIQLNCTHSNDSVLVLNTTTLQVIGYYDDGTRTTVNVPVPAADTTTRRIIGRDTSWSCGSVTSHNVGSNSITHNITRTGVETVHYNVGTPLTVTNNLSQSGTYVDSYTFTGSVSPSLIGTTVPVTFTANGFSFSFGTVLYTVTLGPQAFCQLQYGTTVTLTANGPELSWTYNGGVGYDTLNVSWYHPLTGKRVIDAWASYAYTSNTATPEEWYVLYTEDLATGQRYFEYIPHTTGYITYSASIVTNTVAISASDTTAIRGQINAGRYGARVYNHNSTNNQWLPGMTHSTQNGSSSSTSWTVTYWFVGGTEANHVDLIVGTTDINSGDSRRGHGNGTYVEADNGRLYY